MTELPRHDSSGEDRSPLSAPGSKRERTGENYSQFAADTLRGESPRAVLRRLVDGDPLDLATRAEARLEGRAYLLDADRLVVRSLARVARAASGYRVEMKLGPWLDARIDAAIDDLLRADRRALELWATGQPDAERDRRYSLLAESVGASPRTTLELCVTINDLDGPARHAFLHLVVLQWSVRRYVSAGHATESLALSRLRRALQAVEDIERRDGSFGDDG